MARRNQSDRVLEMLEQDVRLRLVGRPCAMVWLELVRAICRYGEDSVLQLGSAIGSAIRSLDELAYALRIEVSELETQLQTLFGRGLLVAEAAGGIALPAELGLSARAKAARINGLRGGRPRKDGPPPGQRSMLMTIPGGGREKPIVTDRETQGETRLAGTTATATDLGSSVHQPDQSESGSSGSSATPAWVSLACELAEFAGLRRSVTTTELALVNGWLDGGASADTLRGIFRVVLNRENCPPQPSLAYFDGAVRDALAAGIRPQVAPEVAGMAAAAAEDEVQPQESGTGFDAEWTGVRRRLQAEIGNVEYRTWLRQATLASVGDGEVTINLPSRFLRDWANEHYRDRLISAWQAENSEIRTVNIVVAAKEGAAEMAAPDEAPEESGGFDDEVPRYVASG